MWLGLRCHGGNVFFLGGLHGLPHPQRQINGLQRCNSLLCGARSCRAKPYIGSLAVSMALQRLRLLSACMCRRMGSGVVLFNAMAGAVCAAAD